MKIAVTYENGQIFQHFGKTETFKIYDVNDQGIVASEVISAGGAGHSALAGFLAEQGVQVLICGGLGEGAQVSPCRSRNRNLSPEQRAIPTRPLTLI